MTGHVGGSGLGGQRGDDGGVSGGMMDMWLVRMDAGCCAMMMMMTE